MEIEQKIVNITEIKENKDNPRKISKSQLERLKVSLQKFPEMLSIREIVVDENMMILGGNMRYRALKELGEKTVPVKIIKGLSEEQKKEFIIKDNNNYGEWDVDLLQNWDMDLLKDWDLDDKYINKISDNKYVNINKVLVNTYHPDKIVNINDCINTEKYDYLCKKINQMNISEDIRRFLLLSATRFIEFNYKNIANYYVLSSKEVQNMMEELLLVIIDVDDILQNNYLKFTKDILKRLGVNYE